MECECLVCVFLLLLFGSDENEDDDAMVRCDSGMPWPTHTHNLPFLLGTHVPFTVLCFAVVAFVGKLK